MGLTNTECHLVGLDLGRQQDHSALVVVARRPEHPQPGTGEPTIISMYYVIYMKRFELGTPFYLIEEELARIWALPELTPTRNYCICDATGLGAPVVESIRRNRHIRVQAVIITGGETLSKPKAEEYHVAKEHLVSTLVNLVQRRKFRVLEGVAHEDEFFEELSVFGYRVNKRTGNTAYEALKEAVHDDLTIAASLAVWYGETQVPSRFGHRRSHIAPENDPWQYMREQRRGHGQPTIHQENDPWSTRL